MIIILSCCAQLMGYDRRWARRWRAKPSLTLLSGCISWVSGGANKLLSVLAWPDCTQVSVGLPATGQLAFPATIAAPMPDLLIWAHRLKAIYCGDDSTVSVCRYSREREMERRREGTRERMNEGVTGRRGESTMERWSKTVQLIQRRSGATS